MFNSNNKIIILLYENVMDYPPVISLVEGLLNNSISTVLVSQNTGVLPEVITNDGNFIFQKIKHDKCNNPLKRIIRRIDLKKQFFDAIKRHFKENDIVWTINPIVVKLLGKKLVKYNNSHVLELLELTDTVPMFKNGRILKFNMKKYAQEAWKVVVPERNRAYIQRIMWDLKKTPYILPNKPYYYEPGVKTQKISDILNTMKKDKKKIIIYLGIIDPERSIEEFTNAIEVLKDEYSLYVFGSVTKNTDSNYVNDLERKYSCFNYMGFIDPPGHLFFLKYARIALLPYNPGVINEYGFAKLNVLYCAPNKIYEYAGSSVPMVGTDVLALREPFEKYEIGKCCDNLTKEAIIETIKFVDSHHDKMAGNCKKFYDEIDLDSIIKNIVFE